MSKLLQKQNEKGLVTQPRGDKFKLNQQVTSLNDCTHKRDYMAETKNQNIIVYHDCGYRVQLMQVFNYFFI